MKYGQAEKHLMPVKMWSLCKIQEILWTNTKTNEAVLHENLKLIRDIVKFV